MLNQFTPLYRNKIIQCVVSCSIKQSLDSKEQDEMDIESKGKYIGQSNQSTIIHGLVYEYLSPASATVIRECFNVSPISSLMLNLAKTTETKNNQIQNNENEEEAKEKEGGRNENNNDFNTIKHLHSMISF